MKTTFATMLLIPLACLSVSCRAAEDTVAPGDAPDVVPSPVGYVMEPNVQYGTGATTGGGLPLLLDYYRPDVPCTAPRPTMLYVHGGGFQGGSRRSPTIAAFAEALAPRGINLISIDYRLVRDDAVIAPEFARFAADYAALMPNETPERKNAFAAAVEDAVRAMRWMQANASRYCIDPTRIGLWGGSAGSFTIMHVAYALDPYGIPRPTPRVVINNWGALARDTDLEAGEAPLFVLHGTSDDTVPFAEAIELTDRARSVGVPHAFYSVVGGEHAYSGVAFSELTVNGQPILTTTAQFIEAHLKGGTPIYETRALPLPR